MQERLRECRAEPAHPSAHLSRRLEVRACRARLRLARRAAPQRRAQAPRLFPCFGLRRRPSPGPSPVLLRMQALGECAGLRASVRRCRLSPSEPSRGGWRGFTCVSKLRARPVRTLAAYTLAASALHRTQDDGVRQGSDRLEDRRLRLWGVRVASLSSATRPIPRAPCSQHPRRQHPCALMTDVSSACFLRVSSGPQGHHPGGDQDESVARREPRRCRPRPGRPRQCRPRLGRPRVLATSGTRDHGGFITTLHNDGFITAAS